MQSHWSHRAQCCNPRTFSLYCSLDSRFGTRCYFMVFPSFILFSDPPFFIVAIPWMFFLPRFSPVLTRRKHYGTKTSHWEIGQFYQVLIGWIWQHCVVYLTLIVRNAFHVNMSWDIFLLGNLYKEKPIEEESMHAECLLMRNISSS